MANPMVGRVEIVSLLDADFGLPLANVFPDVAAAAWEPYRRLYPAAFKEGSFFTHAQVYVLRAGGQTVIVDAGIGPGANGALEADMRRKGVEPSQVDVVVFTHLHADHVGWAVRDGKAFFPRARHLTPKADWQFFRSPERAAQNAHVARLEALEKAGVLELVEGERTVTAELTLLPTPGHTPGHQSVAILSAGERGYVLGDVVNHPAQLQETEWCATFDNDKPAARTTRRWVVERLEVEGSVFAAGHLPVPGLGRLARVEGRRVFQPL